MKEKLINVIDELVKLLGAFKASVNTYFEGREESDRKFSQQKSEFEAAKSAHEASMKEREEAIKPFEDAIALKKDAEKIMSEAVIKSQEVNTRNAACVSREQEVEKNAVERMTKVNEAEAAIKTRTENLDKREADIEIEVTRRVKEVLSRCGLKKDVIDDNTAR